MTTNTETRLALFNGRHIRKAFQDGEWWFSIIDVIGVLVGGDRPRKYWNDLKKKLLLEGYDQLSDKIGQLKMPSSPLCSRLRSVPVVAVQVVVRQLM